MLISDWSSDVCSSELVAPPRAMVAAIGRGSPAPPASPGNLPPILAHERSAVLDQPAVQPHEAMAGLHLLRRQEAGLQAVDGQGHHMDKGWFIGRNGETMKKRHGLTYQMEEKAATDRCRSPPFRSKRADRTARPCSLESHVHARIIIAAVDAIGREGRIFARRIATLLIGQLRVADELLGQIGREHV